MVGRVDGVYDGRGLYYATHTISPHTRVSCYLLLPRAVVSVAVDGHSGLESDCLLEDGRAWPSSADPGRLLLTFLQVTTVYRGERRTGVERIIKA